MRMHLVIIGLMGVMFAGMSVVETAAVKARPNPPGEKVSSIYALAGEFRTVFANLLWIKADQYHHEFMQTGNEWSCNKELIGLLNLIIVLDPHFVEAYANEVYIYADGYQDNDKALGVLRQGISNNPNSPELHTLAAIMYARRLADPQRALPHARKAVELAEDNWCRTRAKRMLRTIEEMARENDG